MKIAEVDQKTKNELLKIIHKHLPGCRVYLFGSRAKKIGKEGADIDLALDVGKKIDWKILGDIKEEIEETTIPVFVDVVDVNSVDKKFLEHIKTEWMEWKN
jgi:predicted nucleotidyltransferase